MLEAVKQAQVFTKKAFRPALAVLVMGALAACGSGPTAFQSGIENGGPIGSEPGNAAGEAKAEPVGPTMPGGTTVSAPRKKDKSAPDLDLSNRKGIQVDLGQVRQLLPKDAIAPIYDPRFVSPEKAGLDSGELVIGVELNGESKAYPIGPLVRREMVNDTVGGVPILVTW